MSLLRLIPLPLEALLTIFFSIIQADQAQQSQLTTNMLDNVVHLLKDFQFDLPVQRLNKLSPTT